MSDISSRVKAIIVDKLGVDDSEVTFEATFTNDLGADSLDTVELIMEFEKEFDIQIPDDQAENIATVGQAITYIERNNSEAGEEMSQLHTVVSGDTLSKIAKKFYGDAMKYSVIFEANKPMLTDPDKILPGQVLKIPSLKKEDTKN